MNSPTPAPDSKSYEHKILVRSRIAQCDELSELAPTVESFAESSEQHMRSSLNDITIVVTDAHRSLPADVMAACPRLKLIHFCGAGYQNFDVASAVRRNIMVTRSAGAGAITVANHAVALLLSLLRQIPQQDHYVRNGSWTAREGLFEQWSEVYDDVCDRRIGILGMGPIGQKIAQNLSGFDVPISFTATTPKPWLPYPFYDSLEKLADEIDTLIVACPGTPSTFHIVNRNILNALGPKGMLVNIGRGSVVDTDDLIGALQSGSIAGAALDVFEQEPSVPDELKRLTNVILTPHIAGASRQALGRLRQTMLRNIEAFIAGRPPPNPI